MGVTGLKSILANLDKIVLNINIGAEGALEAAMSDLEAKSKELVPVDTGTLKVSASHSVQRRLRGVTGSVKYSAPYATSVHENTTVSHSGGKRAKFLTTPLYENAAKYKAQVEAATRKAVK